MKQSELARIDEIFTAVLELDLHERIEFLNKSCKGDKQLRAQVEALIKADNQSQTTLGKLMGHMWESYQHSKEIQTGHVLGNFEVIELLGTGGMSNVYLAKRIHDDFEQLVAIKVLRIDSGDTEHLYKRFLQEQRLLASLNHPYIAKLLDGGRADDGACYLVMEYVDGMPIDQYCSHHQLSYKQRLELLEKICEAVHFAHCRFVVHRDLKPENIFITEGGLPKLLDFGIAKLLASNEPLGNVTKQHGQVFTPNYSSPELLSGEPVTTATDIYALGVVGYKLLTGCVAHDISTLSMQQALGIVHGQQPKPPSLVLKGLHKKSSYLLPYRKIPKELDKIVLKALAKVPADRYSSVTALQEDLVRFRQNQMVFAASDSRWYRAKKFTHRYGLGLTVLLITMLGLLITNHLVMQERNQLRQAEHLAEQRLEQTRLVTEHLLDAYREVGQRSVDLKASDILDQSYAQLQATDNLPDKVKLDIYLVIGRAYQDIRQHQLAREAIQKAITSAQSLGDSAVDKLAIAYTQMASITMDIDSVEQARDYVEKAKALLSQIPQNNLAAAIVYDYVGSIKLIDGFYIEARADLRKALDIFAIHSEEGVREKNAAILTLAAIEARLGNFQEATHLYSQAVEFFRYHYGENSISYAQTLSTYSIYLLRSFKLNEAEDNLHKIISVYKTQLGIDNNATLFARDQLGLVYYDKGLLNEAKQLYLESLKLRETRKDTSTAWLMVTNLAMLGQIYLDLAELSEAELYLSRAYQDVQNVGFLAYKIRVTSMYGRLLRRVGKVAEAKTLLEENLLKFQQINPQHNDLVLLEAELARAEILHGEHSVASNRLIRIRDIILKVKSEQQAAFYVRLLEAEAELANSIGDSAAALEKFIQARDNLIQRYPENNPSIRRISKSIAAIETSNFIDR